MTDNNKKRNVYLGSAMFMDHFHSGHLQPSVIDTANFVARQDGFEIPYDVSLSLQDKREVVLTAAETTYMGRRGVPTELERLIVLHLVNRTVERGFLSAPNAFSVMNTLTGTKPKHINEYTLENWKSSIGSMASNHWPKIEKQLSELRDKANQIVNRANEAMQHELAEARVHWEHIYQNQLDYVEHKEAPTFDDALSVYMTCADVAWQYKIEIGYSRPLF